jgi:hypothetical protein
VTLHLDLQEETVSGVGKVSQILFAVISPGNIVANLIAGAVAEAGEISFICRVVLCINFFGSSE